MFMRHMLELSDPGFIYVSTVVWSWLYSDTQGDHVLSWLQKMQQKVASQCRRLVDLM